MAAATHQTIRLSRGRHKSPDEGACVMELASLLSGEPFGDHPRSVCPVIGAFLRRYNDSTSDDRRQCLYAYAAEVVGTRGSDEVQRARAERLARWVAELRRRRQKWYWLPERWPALSAPEIADCEIVAGRAVRELLRHPEPIHAETLALIDELIALGAPACASADGSRASSHEPAPMQAAAAPLAD